MSAPLFSTTYWEVPLRPFIFNNLLGAITILEILLEFVIRKLCGGVGVTSSGVVVLRGAFISLLAYTYWLDLSSRQIVIAGSAPWHGILNDLVLVARDDAPLGHFLARHSSLVTGHCSK
jgi:hypothetical protein